MADLVITAAKVLASASGSRMDGKAGEAISAGKAVYIDPVTGLWMLADSNSATAEARRAAGIALNAAALNQPDAVHKSGDIVIGATLTAGVAYYLSDTPGGICLVADVGSGEYVCLIGLAKSTSVLSVAIQFPGVAL